MTTTGTPWVPRTKIRITGLSEVTVRYFDEFDGSVREDVYWIPHSGGYVRHGCNHSADDPQVCVGLAARGPALEAKDRDELLRVIRREWRRSRRDA